MLRRTLHLASGSPRRREILAALGLQFSSGGVDVDEARFGMETASDMVTRLAVAKAEAARGAEVIVGADTVVVLGDEVFGKPVSRDDALRMLAALSGRTHEVLTGVAVRHDGRTRCSLSRSFVRFRDISTDEAARYWQSGEPADKAGAYAVQGLGGIFVAEVRGSYSGVVGLPVFETAALLEAAGIDLLPRTGAGNHQS
ncbi:MAG: Maf family nucleotide pyrophosphatase [Gammaproteobacteria bacterium]|nr:Maf family nucleotide pyrophosphatase [Gammaproteobacteria bacterium]MDH4253851.1 Maf family nucleotide pyrophosphatase [Gammaproteobacteria bacterium]MDH5310444.1 Maf family nucleotide pyrophosphatase [Gammaproteobacteria bacterium]